MPGNFSDLLAAFNASVAGGRQVGVGSGQGDAWAAQNPDENVTQGQQPTVPFYDMQGRQIGMVARGQSAPAGHTLTPPAPPAQQQNPATTGGGLPGTQPREGGGITESLTGGGGGFSTLAPTASPSPAAATTARDVTAPATPTAPGASAMVTTPAIPTLPTLPSAGTTPPPATGGTQPPAATPTAGATASSRLMQMFQAQGGNPADSAGFNAWTQNVTTQFGVPDWEHLPQDFDTRYDPTGTAPRAVGSQPFTPVTTAGAGGNYNQNQVGNQAGSFNTTGSTNTAQNQVTGGTQNNASATNTIGNTNTTGSSATTGTQSGTQTGTTGSNVTATGTQTTNANDTLGFGQLLRDQAGAVGASDTSRMATLQGLAQNGDPALQSQVGQAVARSLSGPQMTGAGDSARARAAGYAGAEVGRQSAGTQLAALQQLAGPTGLASLSTAANPYIGSTSTNTGTTNSTGFSNLVNNLTSASNTSNAQDTNTSSGTSTVGSANNTGFTNMTGAQNETNAGTATGNSSQAAAGQIPQAQQVSTGGGGCVLCTAGIHLGLFRNLRVLRTVIDYKLCHKKFDSAARGYFFVFTPIAHWFLSHPRLARVFHPMARAVVYEELRVAGRRLPLRLWPSLLHWTGHFACHLIGKFPVSGRVCDPVIESIARKHKVWFNLS